MLPTKKTRTAPLHDALDEGRDLPPGARRVLEQVFYGVPPRIAPLASVVPLRPRLPDRPSTDRD